MDSIVENHNRCLYSKLKHPYSDICPGLHKAKSILKEFQALNPEKMQRIDEWGGSDSWAPAFPTEEADFSCSTCHHVSPGSLGWCLACPSCWGGTSAPATVVGTAGGFVCHQDHPRGRQPPVCSCGSWPWPSPVPFAVVQGAAGSEGFVVVFSPPQQGHYGPEGSKQPCKHHHGGSCAPLQPAPCGKRKEGLHAPNKTTGNSCQALRPQAETSSCLCFVSWSWPEPGGISLA